VLRVVSETLNTWRTKDVKASDIPRIRFFICGLFIHSTHIGP